MNESPFYSTQQSAIGVSVADYIDIAENRWHGAVLKGFYSRSGFRGGELFINLPVPKSIQTDGTKP